MSEIKFTQDDHDKIVLTEQKMASLESKVVELAGKFDRVIWAVLFAAVGIIFVELWDNKDAPTAAAIAAEILKAEKDQ